MSIRSSTLRPGARDAAWRSSLALAVASVFVTVISTTAQAQILVVATHPDDDVLIAAGVVHRALQRGEAVRVVYVTNGDVAGTDYGLVRQGEAVAAQGALGMTEEHLIFLGYPDGGLEVVRRDYTSPDSAFTSSAGVSATYGARGLGRADYHTYRFGSPGPYNWPTAVGDLADIIGAFRPAHVFTTTRWDTHTDHSSTYYLVAEAVGQVIAAAPGYNPTIHTTVVWPGDESWPDPADPTAYFVEVRWRDPNDLVWSERESLDVPLDMQSWASSNPKSLAVAAHASQGGLNEYLPRFIHKDEFFWTEQLTGVNRPPVPAAGFDQAVARGASVTLDGSSSFDRNNDPISFRWRQISGPAVSLSSATEPRPTFLAPPADCTLVFELLVTDGASTSVPDAVTVQVSQTGQNLPPTADAGQDQTVGGGSLVTLDGTRSSDPEGQPLTHAWTQASGPPVTLSSATVATPTFTAPAATTTAQTLVFQLVVNDGIAVSVPDSVTVQVSAVAEEPNIAPMAQVLASSQNTSTGQLAIKAVDGVAGGYPTAPANEWATVGQRAGAWIELRWPGSHLVDRVRLHDRPNSDDRVTGGTLTFSDGTSVLVGALDNSGAPVDVMFAARQVSSVRFTVTAVTAATRNVGLAEILVFEATGQNQPPTANAGPDQAVSGGSLVTLDGTGSSDPEGQPLTYAWTQASGPSVTLSSATVASPTFTAPAATTTVQTLVFQLVVRDGLAVSVPDSVTVLVSAASGEPNIAPTAQVIASSQNTTTGQLAVKAVDGVAAGYPTAPANEWATVRQRVGAWIELRWPTPHLVGHVRLHDRPNLYDRVTGGTLTFSDGTSIPVGALDNSGAAVDVFFAARQISWVRFTVAAVSSATYNVGLAEILVFEQAAPPAAAVGPDQTMSGGSLAASASSDSPSALDRTTVARR